MGQYLTALMNAELTHFLGRGPYERSRGESNHRNTLYSRYLTLKGIGDVEVRVPRDRKGEFKTQIIPRSKQYEEEIARDLSLMFLTGISTRSLSMISRRLIGRKISPTEVRSANVELSEAVEKWHMCDLSNVTLGIMDGLPDLKTVFKEDFPKAKVDCQDVSLNEYKKEVADDLRSIFTPLLRRRP